MVIRWSRCGEDLLSAPNKDMKLYEISLSADDLAVSDGALAEKVRAALRYSIDLRERRIEEGYEAVRRKLGSPTTIGGVTYESRAQAAQALGITRATFNKRYPR